MTYLLILFFKPLVEATHPMAGSGWLGGAVVLLSPLKRRRTELNRHTHPQKRSQLRSPWRCYLKK